MSEQKKIIVQHDVNLGDLDRLEKALKGISKGADSGKITSELNKQLKAQEKKVLLEQKELGLIEKLTIQQKNLRRFQKYAKTNEELAAINRKLKENQKLLTQAKNTTQSWGKALGSFQFKFNALGNIAANVASTITRTFHKAMTDAVKTVKEFESAMAGVKAISGATADEFKRLRDEAIRLGGATIFTARQVAEMEKNYAKLGFSTQEILNATEATLSLAAATDEGLAKSSLVAGSTLRAFNLDARETQRVVDVMAKSFTSSALNLEHFAESMKFLAPIAKTAGLTIEETTAIMATLADVGLKGSIAGTSLRNVFLRMADPTSALAKRFGTTVRSGEEFVAMLRTMKEENIDLGEALSLTDRRAVTAFVSLADYGDKVENLTEIFNNASGAAKDMADIRMDTLQGSVTILKSAWEKLIISFESGNGILTRTTRKAVDLLTRLINRLSGVSDEQESYADSLKKVNTELRTDLLIASRASDEYEIRAKLIRDINVKYGEYLPNLIEETATVEELARVMEIVNKQMLGRIIIAQYEAEVKKELEAQARAAQALVDIEVEREKRRSETQTGNIAEIELWKNAYIEAADFNENLIDTSAERMDAIMDNAKKRALKLGLDFDDLLKKFGLQPEKDRIEGQDVGDEKKVPSSLTQLDDFKKEIQLLLKEERKLAEARATLYFEQKKEEINLFADTEEEKTLLLENANAEREIMMLEARRVEAEGLKTLTGDYDGYWQTIIDTINQKIKNIASGVGTGIGGSGEVDPENGMFGGLGKQAREVSDYVIDQLEEINDAEIRLLDQQVDRMNTRISELQRSLDEEYELRREGKANRVALIENEIKEEQRKREEAYKEQAKLEKKKRILAFLAQSSNMAVATTNIWKEATQQGAPQWTIPIAIASTAVMFAAWAAQLATITKMTPKYAEGGWVDGKRHSQGGTLIEAEQGEYVLSRGDAVVFDKMLKSLGADDMTDAWDTIQGVSKKGNNFIIQTNSNSTDDILKEILQVNKEAPKDFGDYIEFEYKGSKYRFKK